MKRDVRADTTADDAAAPTRRTWPAPWLFSLLVLPDGVYLGFVVTALPFLLSRASVPVDRIARVTSLLSLPWVVSFFWALIIDAWLRRRAWLLLASSAMAFCLVLALPMASAGRTLFAVGLGLAGGVAATLVLAACGGLMVTQLALSRRAKASGWAQAGKLGGSALGGALMLGLAEHAGAAAAGVIAGILAFLPALLALTLSEPRAAQSGWSKGRLAEIGNGIGRVMREPRGQWNVLLLVSPIGSGAAMALLPAIARDYGVAASGVIWINGLGGGIVLALGSLAGALLPGHWDRRLTYALAGLLNAAAPVVLIAAAEPRGYSAGAILYLGTTGLCWARYAALLIETVGEGGEHASTRYSIFAGIGNIPLAYMVWLEGVGFRHFGRHGLLWTDMGGNFAASVIAALAVLSGKSLRGRRRLTEA